MSVEHVAHQAEPLVLGSPTRREAADAITDHVLNFRLGRAWWVCMGISLLLLLVFSVSVAVLLLRGVGVWGIQIPVAWGLAITNFVWWIGIGHAGTFISAFLLLMSQGWRTSINRFSEAMTLLAVACAGLFPLLHLGRPWLFYWFIPYPNRLDLWPQWRSPLIWDFVAVMTYGLVSLLFWYLGLLPDLAVVRDRSTGWRRKIYGFFAFGWRGSAYHWSYHQRAYLLLAALATPLVVSVHSIVSLDFAVSLVPGWHSTIFPPYFVAGAIFSGFAMVIMLAVPLREWMGLKNFITRQQLDHCGKLMLATGILVAYGYASEILISWYSGSLPHWSHVEQLFTGAYAGLWYALLCCNVLVPQLLWFRQARIRPWLLFGIALAVQFGMWAERYLIVIASLAHAYVPSTWRTYHATVWDWGLFLGTFGVFSFLFLLFIRFVPVISVHEVLEQLEGES